MRYTQPAPRRVPTVTIDFAGLARRTIAVPGIVQRDYSLIMAMTVIYAFAVAALNLVVDVLYGYIDPRIRYS